MSIKISVIIPVYNVELYLQECLDSVLENFKYFDTSDVEAILVNDGSTDESGNLTKEFCQNNKTFKYFTQDNKGLSEARNTGLSHASGNYIFFLDSDDILEPDTLHTLYSFAEENDCGITQCGMNYYYDDSRYYFAQDTTGFKANTILDKNSAIGLLVDNNKIKNFACGKLYKKEVIAGMRFRPGKYFEDSYWQYKAICSNKYDNYGVIAKASYKYRQRETSITGSFRLNYIDLLEGCLEMCQYICMNYPMHQERCIYRLWKNILYFDAQIRRHNLRLNSSLLSRINNIKSEFRQMSKCLKNNVEYNLWKISPRLAWLYLKSKSALYRLKYSSISALKLSNQ